jgi:hypothetical protein
MGVRLHKWDTYKLKDITGERKFTRGVEVHNLPQNIETYLLGLGYFHFVPDPGQKTPKNIAEADKNINGRLAGTLDGNGKPIKRAASEEVAQLPESEAEEIRVDLDENDKPVFVKPGASCLDDGVEQFVKTPKKTARKLRTKA